MKKKSALGILALTCLSALSVATATACKDEPPVTLNGFDVKENLEVAYGSTVDLEQPFVTDSTGEVLDCWTLVTDDEGNYIHVTAGQFRAEDLDGYTITYVVRASDNTTYEKKTTVRVTGVGKSETVIEADFEQFVSIGDTLEINATCSDENASLTYAVTNKDSGEGVTLTDNTFVLSDKGAYIVKISEVGGTASYSYTIFAQAPAQEGEVEVFDDAWMAKEAFIGGKRQDWSVTTTAECGLYDPFGREASFATFTTKTPNAYGIYINIREDQAYYEQLVNEGYTHVSMWIYMVSDKAHISVHDRDANGGFYRLDGPDIYPGEWTEFLVNLTEGQAAYKRSFNSCYSLYQNENHAYLQVDNSYEWNPWGGGDTMTFYIADIYAVKPVTVTAVEGVDTEAAVGEAMDFSSYFEADCELTYAITHRGETKAIEGSSYTFPANGTFTVTATPTARNLKGSASVDITVTDGHILNSTPVIKERTGDSVNVSMQELSLAFAETDGVTPTVSGYKAYYDGVELALTDGVFTATADGMYTVEVKGVYTKDGAEYATYQSVSVDVWSQATKYSVIDVNNLRAIRAWDWDNSSTTAAYGEYTVGGETGNYIKATAKGQSLVLYGKPVFSKAYYQAMNAQYENMNVLIGVYFAPAATGKTTNFRSIYHPTKAEWFDKYNDQWQSYTMSLSDFINVYDEVESRYEQYKTASYGASTDGYEGSWLQLIGSNMGRTVYMNVTLGAEAAEASVALKDNASIAVNTNNDLRQLLNVTVDGEAGVISSAEIYFNNEWVEVEDCIFAPAWEVEYQFRFNVQSADGLKYKQVETMLTVGDGSFTATVDTDFYSVEIGEVFNLSDILPETYEYRVKLLRSVNGEQTVVAEYDDGTIETADLTAGSYTVNVYATSGSDAFGEILYYTLTLDAWSAEMKCAVLDTQNMKVLRAWDWGSTSFKSAYDEYTVGGRTGEYVRAESNSGSQSLVVYAKPLYSKAYYEALYKENTALNVLMELYHIPGVANGTTNFWSAFTSGVTKFTDAEHNNQWLTYSITLESFIANYEVLDAKYEAKKNATEADGGTGNSTAWVYITGGGLSHIVYFNASIGQEATGASVSLKEGATIAVNTDNALNELLNVTVDGVAGSIRLAEVYFNNEWVGLESCVFNPAWNVAYQFRFYVQSADGLKYKQVETTLTIGDGSFTATVDTDAHIIKTGESFDVATLLTAEYSYEMQTYKSYGGVLTAVEVAEGMILKAENLEIGAYYIEIYAIDGDKPFGKILYYTLTVDYVGDYETTLINAFTADNYKTIFKSYQYANDQYMTDTTVTTECPTGNSGTFLKYEGRSDNRKEALTYALKPMFSANYYASLAKSGNYTVQFDVWIENVNESCARTEGLYYSWNSAGTSFTTQGDKLALGEWHTIEIPLETLANNMANGEFKFFGLYIPYGGFATSDLVRIYMGNIQLVESVENA